MDISYSCCECDPPGSRSCFEERGFFDKELHISNIKKREDFAKIFDSKQWKKFRSTLFEDPKNAPYICQVFCKKSKQKIDGHGKNPKRICIMFKKRKAYHGVNYHLHLNNTMIEKFTIHQKQKIRKTD